MRAVAIRDVQAWSRHVVFIPAIVPVDPRVSLPPMLCAECMSMFLGTTIGKHHATFENLQKASDNGCSICFRISYLIWTDQLRFVTDQSLLHYTFERNELLLADIIPRWRLCFSEAEVGAGGYTGTAFSSYVQSVKEDLNNLDYCKVRDNCLAAADMQQDSTGGTKAMKYAASCLEECERSHQQCHESSQAVVEVQVVSSQ